MSVRDFAALVRKAWGDEYYQPDTAYEWSNARAFKDPGRYGGIYVISTSSALTDRVMNAGDIGSGQEGYTITGIAAALRKTKPIDAAVGSVAITGINVDLRLGPKVPADAGTYAVTGVDATLVMNKGRIVANEGSFSVTGVDASVYETPWANMGTFGITGIDVVLTK